MRVGVGVVAVRDCSPGLVTSPAVTREEAAGRYNHVRPTHAAEEALRCRERLEVADGRDASRPKRFAGRIAPSPTNRASGVICTTWLGGLGVKCLQHRWFYIVQIGRIIIGVYVFSVSYPALLSSSAGRSRVL